MQEQLVKIVPEQRKGTEFDYAYRHHERIYKKGREGAYKAQLEFDKRAYRVYVATVEWEESEVHV
jgi:hypothetical protein